MQEHLVAIGDKSAEEGFQITLHQRVGVLLDEQGAARMSDEDVEYPVLNVAFCNPTVELWRDFMQSSSTGGDEPGIAPLDQALPSNSTHTGA